MGFKTVVREFIFWSSGRFSSRITDSQPNVIAFDIILVSAACVTAVEDLPGLAVPVQADRDKQPGVSDSDGKVPVNLDVDLPCVTTSSGLDADLSYEADSSTLSRVVNRDPSSKEDEEEKSIDSYGPSLPPSMKRTSSGEALVL